MVIASIMALLDVGSILALLFMSIWVLAPIAVLTFLFRLHMRVKRLERDREREIL
jgi:hypothetical protein